MIGSIANTTMDQAHCQTDLHLFIYLFIYYCAYLKWNVSAKVHRLCEDNVLVCELRQVSLVVHLYKVSGWLHSTLWY